METKNYPQRERSGTHNAKLKSRAPQKSTGLYGTALDVLSVYLILLHITPDEYSKYENSEKDKESFVVKNPEDKSSKNETDYIRYIL